MAIQKLNADYNFSYTIVGEGPEENKLKELVKNNQLDHVVSFIPAVPKDYMASFIIGFDIFILASKHDTWGRVYIEAMALGLPVILTKNTGVYGIVTENENALTVDPNDISDIAQKLQYLIQNTQDRKRIGENGRVLVSDMSWDFIAGKYLKIYNTIVS